MNKVIFVNQVCAEATGPWPNWAVISIRNSNDPHKPKIKDGWYAVLRLCFDDVSPLDHVVDPSHASMTEEDAQKIVHFVRTVAPEVDGILIHSKVGISRSAAVARWISEQYGVPFEMDYIPYNGFVFARLCEAGKAS